MTRPRKNDTDGEAAAAYQDDNNEDDNNGENGEDDNDDSDALHPIYYEKRNCSDEDTTIINNKQQIKVNENYVTHSCANANECGGKEGQTKSLKTLFLIPHHHPHSLPNEGSRQCEWP